MYPFKTINHGNIGVCGRDLNDVIKSILDLIEIDSVKINIINRINDEYDKIMKDMVYRSPETIPKDKIWRWIQNILVDNFRSYEKEKWYEDARKIWCNE